MTARLALLGASLLFGAPAALAADPPTDLEAAIAAVERGDSLRAAGKVADAIKAYDEAIRLDPKSVTAFVNRGKLRGESGEWEEAIWDFTQAIRLDPTNTTALNNRGVAWREQKEWDKALADFDQALKIDPHFIRALYCRGYMRWLRKEWDKALADYNEIIRLDPKMEDVRLMRALILRMRGEWKESLADFDEVIRLNPKNALALSERAIFRAVCPDERYRDGKKAVADATEACKLSDWKNADYLHALGVAWAEAGDFNAAIGWEQKALEDADYAKRKGEEAKYYLFEYEAKRPIRGQAVPPAKKP